MSRARIRSSKGQLMASVDLMILIPSTVVLVLFLLNVGVAMYYKQKIAHISNEAAKVAAGYPDAETASSKTQEFVRDLIAQMGISCASQVVEVKPCTLAGRRGATVKVQLTGLAMIGNGMVFPSVIPMEDTATSTDQYGGAFLGQVAIRMRQKGADGANEFLYLPAVSHDGGLEQFFARGTRVWREDAVNKRFDPDNAFEDFDS